MIRPKFSFARSTASLLLISAMGAPFIAPNGAYAAGAYMGLAGANKCAKLSNDPCAAPPSFLSVESQACKTNNAAWGCEDYFKNDPEKQKYARKCDARSLCEAEQSTANDILKGCAMGAVGDAVVFLWNTTVSAIKNLPEGAMEAVKDTKAEITQFDAATQAKIQFLRTVNANPAGKAALARSVPSLQNLSDKEISEMSLNDIVQRKNAAKEADIRTDEIYKASTGQAGRKTNSDDDDSDPTVGRRDMLMETAKSILHGMHVDYECYNLEARADMVCAALSMVVTPGGAAKVAKYVPALATKLASAAKGMKASGEAAKAVEAADDAAKAARAAKAAEETPLLTADDIAKTIKSGSKPDPSKMVEFVLSDEKRTWGDLNTQALKSGLSNDHVASLQTEYKAAISRASELNKEYEPIIDLLPADKRPVGEERAKLYGAIDKAERNGKSREQVKQAVREAEGSCSIP